MGSEVCHRHVVILESNSFGTLLYHIGVVSEAEWKKDPVRIWKIFGPNKVFFSHDSAREYAEEYARRNNWELVEASLPGPLPSLKEALLFQLNLFRQHLADPAHRGDEPLTWEQLRLFSSDLIDLLELMIISTENPR